MKYKYKHKSNRIYFITDFEDNEIVEFAYDCEKPSAKAQGFAYYQNKGGITKLCAKDDLVPIKTNFDRITASVESLAVVLVDFTEEELEPNLLTYLDPINMCSTSDKCLAIRNTIEWLQKDCENG